MPQSRGNPSAGETDRERRLRLRDMERKKRLDGVSGGGYGAFDSVNTSASAVYGAPRDAASFDGGRFEQQRSFEGTSGGSAQSKRDQMWQEKRQRRHESARPDSNPMLPMNSRDQYFGEVSGP